MKTSLFKLLIISSLVLPDLGWAAEDIVISGNPLHIRTLAASCSACHGTQGNAVGENRPTETLALAGVSKAHLMERLMQFRTGARNSTVMYRHAKGLTVEEIDQLADYFSRQMPAQHYSPQPQKLKAME